MQVGSLTKSPGGSLIGKINTLSFGLAFWLTINSDQRGDDPHAFNIMAKGAAGECQIGRAWDRKGQTSGKPYISLYLEAPEIPDNMRNVGALPETEGNTECYRLLWSPPVYGDSTRPEPSPQATKPAAPARQSEIPF